MTYISCKHNISHSVAVRQNGFSLIELMIAILIGLFITLGLSQIFLSMYSTSQSQNALFQYQNNQRMGLVVLTNTAQLAGYYPTVVAPTAVGPNTTALPATANTGDGSTFTAGAGIVGTATGSGSTEQDTLDIQYQSSGVDNVFNCQGGVATTTTTFISSFSINASNQLVCAVSTNGGTPNTPLVIANNIQSMSILYAIDTTGGSTTPAPADTTNAYMNATSVQANAMWLYVRAVQITLNFCTANVLNPDSTSCSTTTPWVQTINLMGKS
jgi:type IV pilus assembly protein PilW